MIDSPWHTELAELLLHTSHLTLWDLLVRAAQRSPDRPAVVAGPESVTYGELVARGQRSAARLRSLDVRKGTVVALMLPATLDWVVLTYAAARLGAVTLPINVSYSGREIAAVLANARPEIIIAADEYADRLPAAERVFVLPGSGGHTDPVRRELFGAENDAALSLVGDATPDDPASVVYTSGSTAAPKGAVIAHRGLSGAGSACAHALQVTEFDRFVLLFPPFHVTGPAYLAAVASAGASIHLIGVFEAGRALDAIEHGRCTVTFCLPTHFTKLMAHPSFPDRDVSSLSRVGLGGSRGFWERLHESFRLDSIITCYGSTELSSMGAVTEPAHIPQSHGRPLPGMDFRIVEPQTGQVQPAGEPGEICFRGWGQFLGYLTDTGIARPDEVDDAGFFHTGDFGHLDADGQLHYRGRYKMMVKSGGENVAELEVETFLEENLDVVDVAQVVGAPDPVWGEAVVAFVQLRPDAQSMSTEELRARCGDGIARFKVPKLFITVQVQDWPLLPTNKIDKAILRQRAAEAYDSRASHGKETVR